MNPSSFLPFCKVNDKELGEKIEGFSIPACNNFDLKQLNGEVCYSIDMNKYRETFEQDNVDGKIRLTLLIDLNLDKAADFDEKFPDPQENEIKIHIDTINGFSSYGPGTLFISSIQQMETTEAFDDLSPEERMCTNDEGKGQCIQRKFSEIVQNKCKLDVNLNKSEVCICSRNN